MNYLQKLNSIQKEIQQFNQLDFKKINENQRKHYSDDLYRITKNFLAKIEECDQEYKKCLDQQNKSLETLMNCKMKISKLINLDKIIKELNDWIKDKSPSEEKKLNIETNQKEINALKSRINRNKNALNFMVMCVAAIALHLTLSISTNISLPMLDMKTQVVSIILLSISIFAVRKFIDVSLRKKRLMSENFRNFVQLSLIERLKFFPKKSDLLDNNLHILYKEWKLMTSNDVNEFRFSLQEPTLEDFLS